jgi:hypothetical protein
MNGLPGNPVTSSGGLYSATVDYGWSGKIIPLRYAYGFEPNSRTYSNVTSDQNDQDYTGRLMTFVISGFIRNDCNIPIRDVEVNAGNGSGSSITDANGYYEVWVSYNWSGTVTPGNKPHYTFEPTGIEYTNVLENKTGQDFAAENIYDLNCDDYIDYGDIAVISENWLKTGPNIPGDFDKNNTVNFLDFAEFATVW